MQLSILIEKGNNIGRRINRNDNKYNTYFKKTSAWIDHGILSGRGNNVVKG
jgi:hypothetical protein